MARHLIYNASSMYPLCPELTELYITWSGLYCSETYKYNDRITPDVKGIILQAYDNMCSPALEDGISHPKLSLIALEGHLAPPTSALHRSIIDFPLLEGTESTFLALDPLILRVWDTNKIAGTYGTIGYNESPCAGSNIDCCTNRTFYKPSNNAPICNSS